MLRHDAHGEGGGGGGGQVGMCVCVCFSGERRDELVWTACVLGLFLFLFLFSFFFNVVDHILTHGYV